MENNGVYKGVHNDSFSHAQISYDVMGKSNIPDLLEESKGNLIDEESKVYEKSLLDNFQSNGSG